MYPLLSTTGLLLLSIFIAILPGEGKTGLLIPRVDRLHICGNNRPFDGQSVRTLTSSYRTRSPWKEMIGCLPFRRLSAGTVSPSEPAL